MKRIQYAGILLSCVLLLTGCSLARDKRAPQTEQKPDIIIGVEEKNAPYYQVEENGTGSGFYVELVKLLAKKGGFSYSFCAMNPAEVSETKDNVVFLGTTDAEEGKQEGYVQTEPVLESGLCLVVKKKDNIKNNDDLRGISIAGIAGTGEERLANFLASRYDADSIVFVNGKSSREDFYQGYAKAIVMDERTAEQELQKNTELCIMKRSSRFFNRHCFTSAASAEILEKLSEALRLAGGDGSLEELLQKYGWQRPKNE